MHFWKRQILWIKLHFRIKFVYFTCIIIFFITIWHKFRKYFLKNVFFHIFGNIFLERYLMIIYICLYPRLKLVFHYTMTILICLGRWTILMDKVYRKTGVKYGYLRFLMYELFLIWFFSLSNVLLYILRI